MNNRNENYNHMYGRENEKRKESPADALPSQAKTFVAHHSLRVQFVRFDGLKMENGVLRAGDSVIVDGVIFDVVGVPVADNYGCPQCSVVRDNDVCKLINGGAKSILGVCSASAVLKRRVASSSTPIPPAGENATDAQKAAIKPLLQSACPGPSCRVQFRFRDGRPLPVGGYLITGDEVVLDDVTYVAFDLPNENDSGCNGCDLTHGLDACKAVNSLRSTGVCGRTTILKRRDAGPGKEEKTEVKSVAQAMGGWSKEVSAYLNTVTNADTCRYFRSHRGAWMWDGSKLVCLSYYTDLKKPDKKYKYVYELIANEKGLFMCDRKGVPLYPLTDVERVPAPVRTTTDPCEPVNVKMQYEILEKTDSKVNHPAHYGGNTTYEAIKVIEAWKLDFCLGNAVKYISRAGKKDVSAEIEDLEKAQWYIARRIHQLKNTKA